MDPSKLDNIFQFTSGSISSAQILINIFTAIGLGLFTFYTYRKTYSGVSYSHSFNVTMLLVSLVTCSIIMVIGNNITLSLGMVGALSIVRFRTAIKDPKDVAFLFWSIAIGLAAGAGALKIAIISQLTIGPLVWIIHAFSKNLTAHTLALNMAPQDFSRAESVLAENSREVKLLSKSADAALIRCIYEVKLSIEQEQKLFSSIQEMIPNASFQLIANETTLGL